MSKSFRLPLTICQWKSRKVSPQGFNNESSSGFVCVLCVSMWVSVLVLLMSLCTVSPPCQHLSTLLWWAGLFLTCLPMCGDMSVCVWEKEGERASYHQLLNLWGSQIDGQHQPPLAWVRHMFATSFVYQCSYLLCSAASRSWCLTEKLLIQMLLAAR